MPGFESTSPDEPKECPENCEFLGVDWECTAIDCVYEEDEDTRGDRKYHERRDR